MIRISIFGASMTYGVGCNGPNWVDMLKFKLRKEDEELVELYSFSKPGVGIDFVNNIYDEEVDLFCSKIKDEDKHVTILCIGVNSSRAVGDPNNFICGEEDFKEEILSLIDKCKQKSDQIIFVGFTPVNETLTNPKINPFNNTRSFFTNKRISAFNDIARDCAELNDLEFIDLDFHNKDWLDFIISDGIHLNKAGHDKMFEIIWSKLANNEHLRGLF